MLSHTIIEVKKDGSKGFSYDKYLSNEEFKESLSYYSNKDKVNESELLTKIYASNEYKEQYNLSNTFDENAKKAFEASIKNKNTNTEILGHDFTFSAPKSVSVAFALANENEKIEITKAQNIAVEKALEELKKHFKSREIRRNYTEKEWKKLSAEERKDKKQREEIYIKAEANIIASFLHIDSREGDPQLHNHVYVSNSMKCEDGKVRSLNTIDFYTDRDLMKRIGDIYKKELSIQMSKLNYNTTLTYNVGKDLFDIEIKGIGEDIKNHFSKRSNATKGKAQSWDDKTDTLKITRKSKKSVDFHQDWKEQIKTNFSNYENKNIKTNEVTYTNKVKEMSELDLIDCICKNQIKLDISKYKTLLTIYHDNKTSEEIEKLLEEKLNNPELFVKHIDKNEENKIDYIPAHLHDMHIDIVSNVNAMNLASSLPASSLPAPKPLPLPKATAELFKDNRAQLELVTNLHNSNERVQLVVGLPGTGKSFSLAQYAALQKNKNIFVSTTSQELQSNLEKDFSNVLNKVNKKVNGSNIAMLLSSKAEQNKLNKDSILIIDEAGMIGVREMKKIIDLVNKKECKLILLGDPQQLTPVSAGNPFQTLIEEKAAKTFYLDKIMRQKTKEGLELANAVSSLDIDKTFDLINKQDIFKVSEKLEDNIKEAVKDYMNTSGTKLILCSTNEELKMINNEVQQAKIKNGELFGTSFDLKNTKSTTETEYKLMINDTIQFTENAKKDRKTNSRLYNNNMKAKVLNIEEVNGKLRIELEKEDKTKFSLDVEKNNVPFRLGYGCTIHASQGLTVDNTFYIARKTPLSNANNLNVALTRHRNEVKIYGTQETKDNFKQIYGSKADTYNIRDIVREIDIEKKEITKENIENGIEPVSIEKYYSKKIIEKFREDNNISMLETGRLESLNNEAREKAKELNADNVNAYNKLQKMIETKNLVEETFTSAITTSKSIISKTFNFFKDIAAEEIAKAKEGFEEARRDAELNKILSNEHFLSKFSLDISRNSQLDIEKIKIEEDREYIRIDDKVFDVKIFHDKAIAKEYDFSTFSNLIDEKIKNSTMKDLESVKELFNIKNILDGKDVIQYKNRENLNLKVGEIIETKNNFGFLFYNNTIVGKSKSNENQKITRLLNNSYSTTESINDTKNKNNQILEDYVEEMKNKIKYFINNNKEPYTMANYLSNDKLFDYLSLNKIIDTSDATHKNITDDRNLSKDFKKLSIDAKEHLTNYAKLELEKNTNMEIYELVAIEKAREEAIGLGDIIKNFEKTKIDEKKIKRGLSM